MTEINVMLDKREGGGGFSSIRLGLILPIIFVAAIGYWQIKNVLHEYVEPSPKLFAALVAHSLEAQLNGIIDAGNVFANRTNFKELVAEKKWGEAITFANSLTETKLNNFVDLIAIADKDGNFMATSPRLESIIGRNFAYRDWYKGVSREWKPYVSEIFQRIASPQYKIVAVAIPVFHPLYKDLPPTGILILQIRQDRFLDWLKQIKIGDTEFIYVVDQKGHIIAHPKIAAEQNIVSFASVPAVQKVLKGESGSQVYIDPIDGKRKSAVYEPLTVSGWGVVVEQQEALVTAMQNKVLAILAITYGIIAIYFGFLVSLAIRSKKPEKL